jgi:predicted GNAT family acetyltransferase
MIVTRSSDPRAFYTAVEAHVLAHEAENGLLIGIAQAIMRAPDLYPDPYLAAVTDKGAVVLACLMTPPQNIILSYAPDLAVYAAAIPLLIADVHTLYPALPGVTAPSRAAAAFAAGWSAQTGQPARVAVYERLYRLERVTPARPTAGTMRAVTPADRALMIDWLLAFQIEAFGTGSAEGIARHYDLTVPTGLRRYVVWEDDGQIVSMSGAGGMTPHGIRIGPVYTPPALRGRGYASACVGAFTQLLLDEGYQFVTLFTDLANPTSNRIYQALGYSPVTDFHMMAFDAIPFA